MHTESINPPYRLKVDPAGRVVIPVELRQSMKVTPGLELYAELDHEGALRLRTLEQVIAHLQACYSPLKSKDVPVSAELIQDRRDEACRE